MLMRNERLAALRTDYDEASHTLTIHWEGREAARGDLRTPEGRAAIERFFADYCADELRGPPKVLFGEGHSFSDVAKKVVSIINLASVAAVESAVGAPVNPLRFRGNVYVAAGRPGTSSICSTASSASAARGSRWSSASCAARRPRSIPTPASATSPFRARSCRTSATPIAASMPR